MGNGAEDVHVIAALHAAARWYCISAQPDLMPGSEADYYNHPTEEDEEDQAPTVKREWTRGDFWHDQFMPALLWEIERGVPSDFGSLDQLRAFLANAGRAAASSVWACFTDGHHFVVWTDERADDAENLHLLEVEQQRFEAHIAALVPDDFRDMASLPYRRTLSEEEVGAIWKGLHIRWPDYTLWFLGSFELEHYEHRHVEGVHRFWWSRFAENVPLDAVRSALRDAGIKRVWQIDDEHACEVEVDTFVPEGWVSSGEERHFTSDGFDWVIYCDHETRITVAGDLIVDLVRRVLLVTIHAFLGSSIRVITHTCLCGERTYELHYNSAGLALRGPFGLQPLAS